MRSAVWTRAYDVDSRVVTPRRRLGLVGLLAILQDIAWLHGDRLGFGYEAMIARGHIWVLARQRVVVDEWPVWGETVEVRTRVGTSSGLFALRDYEVMRAGRRLAVATAAWLVLDASTRRPVRFDVADLGVDPVAEVEGRPLPGKIAVDDRLAAIAGFDVRISDLDVNGHVNNTRYAQWILDSLPLDAHRDHVVGEYEVNFLSETGVGDHVAVESDLADPDRDDDALRFQGRRAADGRAVFTARLRVSPCRSDG